MSDMMFKCITRSGGSHFKTLSFFYVQLTSILYKMNFTLDNQKYSFNEYGDFENGYDLIMWKREGDERVPDVVGKFLISKNDIEVYEHKITRKAQN